MTTIASSADTRPRRRPRRALALVAGAAAVVGGGAFSGAAAPQTAGEVGWHQKPFASWEYIAWLDRSGQGAVVLTDHTTEDGDPEPWAEYRLSADGVIGPLTPIGQPPADSTPLFGGRLAIFATPEGPIARSAVGWRELGDPGLPGRLGPARANERGDVLVGNGRRLAIRTNGRWVRSPSLGEHWIAEMALGEDGSAVVAWTASRRGTALPRIESLRYLPGSGWRRLPAIRTEGAPRPGGLAIDGSGIATFVYSTRAEGVRSVTLAPGASRWERPVRVGPGEISSVGADLAGNVWAVTQPRPDATRLRVMSRAPGGAWRRSATFGGVSSSVLVTPLGDVVVSMVDPDFDGTWSLARRDAVTRRWTAVPGFYAGSGSATNRAGDIVSVHIHPIEQGNFPQAFIDRYVAAPRAAVSAVRAPARLRRGVPATIRATVSGPGPVLVTVSSGARRQIAASAVARRRGTVAIRLPGRLTRMLPVGRARITVDTGGHERARSVRSARVSLVGR